MKPDSTRQFIDLYRNVICAQSAQGKTNLLARLNMPVLACKQHKILIARLLCHVYP